MVVYIFLECVLLFLDIVDYILLECVLFVCLGYEFVLLIVCNVVIYVCIFVGKNLEEPLSHMSNAVHVLEDEVFMFSEESRMMNFSKM